MARYIDANKLEKHFIEDVSKHNLTINGNDYPVFLVDHTLHEIRNTPIADVVEVVRCKDCKHKKVEQPNGIIHCRRDNSEGWIFRKTTDYCSCGERDDK